MDSNLVLLWTVAAFVAAAMPRAVRAARSGRPSWLYVHLVVALVTGATAWWRFDLAGPVGAIALCALVLGPGLLQRRIGVLLGAQRYREALPLTRLLAVLHPGEGYPALPRFVRALDDDLHGRHADAARALAEIAERTAGWVGPQARLHLARVRGDWASFLATLPPPSARVARNDPALLMARLRALGELGRLDELVAAYALQQDQLSQPGHAELRALCQLFVSAYTGREALVDRLVAGPLAGLAARTHRHFRAVAAYAAGDPRKGRVLLESLQTSEHSDPNGPLARLLAGPPSEAAPLLSPESERTLDGLALQLVEEQRYDTNVPLRKARVTVALMVLNGIVFVLEELLGGSEDPPTLYDMGALVAGDFSAAESYRVLCALFLHVGPIHLSMNVLGLSVLGPFVEATLGKVRMLIVYLTSGLGGTLLIALWPVDEPHLMMGASGSIMGLLGAMTAILVVGHRHERARTATRRLGRIALVLVLQLAFDLSIPNISLTAHWVGVALGFVAAYALAPRTQSSRARA